MSQALTILAKKRENTIVSDARFDTVSMHGSILPCEAITDEMAMLVVNFLCRLSSECFDWNMRHDEYQGGGPQFWKHH